MKYKMLVDSKLEPKATKGTIVYQCSKYDYGCASDDESILGVPCMSVTLNEDGDYPFFVVRISDIEEES